MQFRYKNKCSGVNHFLYWPHGHLFSLLPNIHCALQTQEANDTWAARPCFSWLSPDLQQPSWGEQGLQGKCRCLPEAEHPLLSSKGRLVLRLPSAAAVRSVSGP